MQIFLLSRDRDLLSRDRDLLSRDRDFTFGPVQTAGRIIYSFIHSRTD